MIISTTDGIDGRKIARYLGVVSGDAVMGTNMFRDLFAGLRDIVGGRSGAYEKELKRAKQLAIEEMVAEAQELGVLSILTGRSSGSISTTSTWAARTARC